MTNKKLRLFDEQIARKPNLYPWTETFIRAMWHGFWTPDEFDFKADVADFRTEMTEKERQLIVRCLTSIGQVEIAVKKFWAQLGNTLRHPSINDLGYVMANVEVIHNEAYEKLLSVLGLEKAFDENLKVPVVQNRVKYLKKYLEKNYEDEKKQYIYAIILFTLFVENVSLFSQFYIITWFNRYKNMLKDTSQQVQYTRLEEQIHAQVGIKIINTIREEYPELFDVDLTQRVISECKEAYEAEAAIIDWIVGDYEDEAFSAAILKEYIKNRFNDSLEQIAFPRVFDVEQQLVDETRWMDLEVVGVNMTDFFHKKPVDYAKKHKTFSIDDLGF